MHDGEPNPEPRLRRGMFLRRVALPALLLGSAVALLASGALDELDVEAVRARIAGAGPAGPLLYLLAFSLLQPFGLSGHVFVLTAALIWPPALAVAMAWLGSMGSAVVAFATARTVGRDFIQARVPPRLHRWDEALSRNGLRTVLLLRLVFWTTFLVQLSMGLSRLRWRDYLLGTAIGNLPLIVLEVWLGDRLFAWLEG